MADESERKAPPAWREYTIQLPMGVATVLERALDDQVALENRAIGHGEFICWLVSLGLTMRSQLVKAEKKSRRRIIAPGE